MKIATSRDSLAILGNFFMLNVWKGVPRICIKDLQYIDLITICCFIWSLPHFGHLSRRNTKCARFSFKYIHIFMLVWNPKLGFLWMLVRLSSSIVGKLYNVGSGKFWTVIIFSVLDQRSSALLACDPLTRDPASGCSVDMRGIRLYYFIWRIFISLNGWKKKANKLEQSQTKQHNIFIF